LGITSTFSSLGRSFRTVRQLIMKVNSGYTIGGGLKTSDHAKERDPSRELSVSINYGCKTAVDKEPLI